MCGRYLTLLDVALALVDLAAELRQLDRSLTKENGRVGLRNESPAGKPEDPSEDGHDAFHPFPANGFSSETTDDGAQGRAEKRCCSEDTHGETALFGREHVGDDAASVSQGRRAKCAGEEPEDEESPDVLRSGGPSVEEGKHGICPDE